MESTVPTVPTELEELPQTEKAWETTLPKYSATGDRYELSSASSASKIEVEEFLALRTLWVEKDLRTLQESHEDFGLKGSLATEAYRILKDGTPGWSEYLKYIENNTSTKPLDAARSAWVSALIGLGSTYLSAFNLPVHHFSVHLIG